MNIKKIESEAAGWRVGFVSLRSVDFRRGDQRLFRSTAEADAFSEASSGMFCSGSHHVVYYNRSPTSGACASAQRGRACARLARGKRASRTLTSQTLTRPSDHHRLGGALPGHISAPRRETRLLPLRSQGNWELVYIVSAQNSVRSTGPSWPFPWSSVASTFL